MVEKINYDTKNKSVFGRMWTTWADYFDLRIMTGKVFPDIIRLLIFLGKQLGKTVLSLILLFYNSPPMKVLRYFASKLLIFEGIKIFVVTIVDGAVLWGRYYYAFFLIFSLAFFSVFVLFRFLQDSIIGFFIVYLPLLLINSFSQAVLYVYIDKKEKKDQLAFSKIFQSCLHNVGPISILTLFHVFFIVELIVFFFMFSLFFSNYFDSLAIDWRTSFYYWLGVICFGLLILITVFLFTIINHQAYLFSLLDKKSIVGAISSSHQFFKKYFSQFLMYYVALSACFIPFIYFAIQSFSDVAFALIVLFYSQSLLFFSFLLRRKFLDKSLQNADTESQKAKSSPLSRYSFITLFFFGMISYALSGWFIIQVYPRLVQFIEQQYEETVILQNLVTYHNEEYGYAINYPVSWSFYKWGENSITFAGNYNETPGGFLSVTVSIFSLEESDYNQIAASKPGLLYYDPETKDLMTKISDDKDMVTYTYVKNGDPFTEYETHYLFKRNDRVYDLTFMARSKEAEKANEKLFKKMYDSFKISE